jgi:hypothetical protein
VANIFFSTNSKLFVKIILHFKNISIIHRLLFDEEKKGILFETAVEKKSLSSPCGPRRRPGFSRPGRDPSGNSTQTSAP